MEGFIFSVIQSDDRELDNIVYKIINFSYQYLGWNLITLTPARQLSLSVYSVSVSLISLETHLDRAESRTHDLSDFLARQPDHLVCIV